MYIYPISFQSNTAVNNFTELKHNSSFKGSQKNFKYGFSAIPAMLTIPLLKKEKFINDEEICNKVSVQNENSKNKSVKKSVKPKHHPDFYKLRNEGYEILASNYFRRGGAYGSPSDEFVDVIKAMRVILKSGLISFYKDNKVKMLIGGIGESQEPFSLLATAKSIMGEENMSDYLDTYIVDLQTQPGKDTLFKQSYYDSCQEPKFVKTSFIEDLNKNDELPSYRKYRVTDDIFEYLLNTYNNSEKSKWRTRIQDALNEYPDEEFDIVSINNTLMYIIDTDELKNSIKNIYRTLKPGGIFISDDRLKYYKDFFTPANSVEIYPGIYQKLQRR